MREAMFWSRQANQQVRCELCRFYCLIGEGQRGRCRVRENRAGVLYSLNYGLAAAVNVDPVEKKPLFHYYPGSRSFSIGAMGCNFKCLHCQNASISQVDAHHVPSGHKVAPAELVAQALAAGCRSVAYTYTEPTVFYEYVFETATLAHGRGLGNLLISNGYMAEEPLRQLAPILDAANIDLKGFTPRLYKKLCAAELEPVLASLKLFRQLGIWLEVTTLLIPGHNDDDEQLRGIAGFIYNELGAQTPWHVTAFFPTYRLLDAPPTPVETLQRARQIGLEVGLHYVYEGNVVANGGEDTRCPQCGKVVLERRGYTITAVRLVDGCCAYCGAVVAGVGLDNF